MSDFFTRLAERTLGLALIIQPIKPSLFAPEADSSDETLLEIDEESEAAQAFSDMPTSERSIQTRAAELSTALGEHVQAEQLPDALPSNGINSIHARNDPAPGKLVSARRRVPTTGPRSSDAAQAQGLTVVTQGIDAAPRPSDPRASMATIAQPYREAPETGLSFALVEQEHNNNSAKRIAQSDGNTGLDGDNASQLYMEKSALLREQTIVQGTVLGERSGHSPQLPIEVGAPNRQTRAEAAMPEAAIQVTIGRVEVRAVTAPTRVGASRPPTRHSASSPMSLNEYLRRQEQGGR